MAVKKASPTNREVLGDWSNLKGNHYHLVYVLWLLLKREAEQVMFFAGNDLLARPITLQAHSPTRDIWIQLKATDDAWTPSALLDPQENLLVNFLLNALESISHDTPYEIRLVSTAPVRRDKVEEFVTAPTRQSVLNSKLEVSVTKALQLWKETQKTVVPEKQCRVTHQEVRQLALRILREIAQSQPMPLETLVAQIETRLTQAFPHARTMREKANALFGALQRDVSPTTKPERERVYDLQWMAEHAGDPLRQYIILEQDLVALCEEGFALPPNWDAAHWTPRPECQKALQDFLAAPETVFVLLGQTGAGKSWLMAGAAVSLLAGRVRVLVPGDEFQRNPSLSHLLTFPLRSLGMAVESDELLARRLRAAAEETAGTPIEGEGNTVAEARGQLVLLLDDVRPSADPTTTQRDLANLVRECRQQGVKLVISCQESLWLLNLLGTDIQPDALFRVRPVSLSEPSAAPNPQAANSQQAKGETKTRNREERAKNALVEGAASFSFLLINYSADEQEQLVRRRFPHWSPERVDFLLTQLNAPSYAPLRNPYLLQIYLDQHHESLGYKTRIPPPSHINDLLEERLAVFLRRVAPGLRLDTEELRVAVIELAASLRDSPVRSRERNAAIATLEDQLPTQGADTFAALREGGLLLVENRVVRFSERSLEDWLVAQKVRDVLLHSDESFVSQLNTLDPARDAGAVVALLRGLDEERIMWAERLLGLDYEAWLDIVVEGLSQGEPDNWQTLSLLTILARPRGEESILDVRTFRACESLGRYATQGRRSRRWLATMYLRGGFEERVRAQHALRAAMDVSPRWVGRVVQLRLYRAASMPYWHHNDREQRDFVLHDALTPFNSLRNRRAASVAREVIDRYSNLTTHYGDTMRDGNVVRRRIPFDEFDYRFMEDVDEVCGNLLRWEDDAQIETLFEQLKNSDELCRTRATNVLCAAAYEHLDRLQAPLLEAIRTVQDPWTLSQLLWAVYGLTKRAPDELLAAIKQGLAGQWKHYELTGATLTLLGNLAEARPQRVFALLPGRLTNLKPHWRALLSEVLSYAWWRCAEFVPAAWSHLDSLVEPDFEGLDDDTTDTLDEEVAPQEDEEPSSVEEGTVHLTSNEKVNVNRPKDKGPGKWIWKPLAMRGVLIARLALVSREVASAQVAIINQSIYKKGGWLLHHWTDITRFMGRYAVTLVDQSNSPGLREQALECVLARHRWQVPYPSKIRGMGKGISNAQFHTGRSSLEIWVRLLAQQPCDEDTIKELERLPAGWEGWERPFAARRLMELGHTEEILVEWAQRVCRELESKWDGNSERERNLCQARLMALRPDAQEAFREQRDQHISFFGGPQTSSSFAVLAQRTDSDPLALLNTSLKDTNGLPILHDLHKRTRDWRLMLLARVYLRCFDSRPLTPNTALALCEQFLVGVRTLPPSAAQRECEAVYTAIWNAYHAQPTSLSYDALPPCQTGDEAEGSLLLRSQRRAIELLIQGNEVSQRVSSNSDAKSQVASWLIEAIRDRAGWTESGDYHLDVEHGTLGGAMGYYVAYVFPVVRLAAVAISQRCGVVDPVATFLRQRQDVHKVVHEHDHITKVASQDRHLTLQRANIDFERLEREIDFDERLESVRGLLRLLKGELDEAEVVLSRCLGLPLCEGEKRGQPLYNLACVYARMGKSEEARQRLEESHRFFPLDAEHIMKDTDFESVRHEEWFSALVETARRDEAARTKERLARNAARQAARSGLNASSSNSSIPPTQE